MAGKTIEMKAGDGSGTFSGYLARPASGSGPGLVIAQEIFGVNQTMREVADRYAEEGYVALVPDLFWRQQPNIELGHSEADMKKAFALFGGFDEAKGVDDLQVALTTLRSMPEVTGAKVGTLGFCLGGKLAYLAACRTDTDVAVGYYGVGIDKALDEAGAIRCPVLLHIAEQDHFCPPEARSKILEALQSRPEISTQVYPGVDHAFAREGGDAYDRSAAQIANQRTIVTLKTAIGPHSDSAAH